MTSSDHRLIRQSKLARLRVGGTSRALEICSGCGGLSLGLQAAGFELSAHVEIDPEAAETYAINFGARRDDSDPWSLPRNMEKCSADELVAATSFEKRRNELWNAG
jgi:DNA (cytosine-5)-methyltransferase 1